MIGVYGFEIDKPKGGRPIKYCELNEPQVTLLISYLDNSDKVADFKVELVRQFFEMRKILAEKKTTTWTDKIKDFPPGKGRKSLKYT